MRAAFCGSMIPTITSHLVFLLAKPLSQKNQTQCPGIRQQKCPGIILKCPGITQLPSLVMRARARPLKISQALCGIIQTSPRTRVLALVTVTQCPGLMCKTVMMCDRKQFLFLPKRKEIDNIEEREEREREQREERYLIMMRAGPVSARETHPVPAFQHK